MNHTSILSPGFRYVPSAATDLRQTFNRLRREQPALDRRKAQQAVPAGGERRKGR